MQIVGCKLQLKANGLMSESSSLACDQITKRLLEFIVATDVFRILFSVREKYAESERCNRDCFDLGGWHVYRMNGQLFKGSCFGNFLSHTNNVIPNCFDAFMKIMYKISIYYEN